MSDEVMLQRAEASAARLLQHLSGHARGNRAHETGPGAAVAVNPASELEAAIISLRKLIAVLQKEPGTR